MVGQWQRGRALWSTPHPTAPPCPIRHDSVLASSGQASGPAAEAAQQLVRSRRDQALLLDGLHLIVVGTTDSVRTVVQSHTQVRSAFSDPVVLDRLEPNEVHQLVQAPVQSAPPCGSGLQPGPLGTDRRCNICCQGRRGWPWVESNSLAAHPLGCSTPQPVSSAKVP